MERRAVKRQKWQRVICPRCGREGLRFVYRRYVNGKVYEYVRVEHGKWFDPERGKWVHDMCHLGPLHYYGYPRGEGTGRGVPLPVKLMHITNLESIDFSDVVDRATHLLIQVADFSARARSPELIRRWMQQLERIAESADALGEAAGEKAVELMFLVARAQAAIERKYASEPLPIALPKLRSLEGARAATEDELLLLRITKGVRALSPKDAFSLETRLKEVARKLRKKEREKEEGVEREEVSGAPALTQPLSARAPDATSPRGGVEG